MPIFKYIAKNQDAKNVVGKIVAEDQASVIEELRTRKLTIISVKRVKEGNLFAASFTSKKVKKDELVIFTRQLATMVEAGIPILQSLDALQEQMTQPYFQQIIGVVKDDIETGSSLSAAFSKHPKVFDTLFVNMIKVGETGGVLNTILDRISSYSEKTLKLQRKVKSALIYPSVIVGMAMAITIFLLVKVVPTFSGIYASFQSDLPVMTQTLINISDFLKQYFLLFGGGVILFGFSMIQWYHTDQGSFVIDRIMLRLPVFGELLRKVAISRFSRTFATLLQSGVPILAALDIVSKTSGNRVIERVVDNIKNSVREGESIAGPLAKSGVFPPMVTRMVAVGEKSGQMEKMLTKIAEFYDDQVDAAVSGLTSIIEPLIIGLLGLVIGFIVVALFLPILNITQLV